ncbi:hypothetical protein MMC14_002809 [Varicellaria rhodocarpa]|nr:hypothetical protein [Varicellaria rhodocarpa]
MSPPILFRYILQTSVEFPTTSTTILTPNWSNQSHIISLLSLLPPAERDAVLRYRRSSDAALSLGSNLLKHLAVSHTCGVPWLQSIISRHPENGKPCYAPPVEDSRGLEFNVSHHGEVVVLVGATHVEKKRVGIDVVKAEDRRAKIDWEREGGWEGWVRVFEEVFANVEIQALLDFHPRDTGSEDGLRTAKMRLFYAYWALKEAYIKMTGEALMAPWLKALEFRKVTAPDPMADNRWGLAASDFEIWLKGSRVEGVRMELQAWGKEYLVATAVSGEEQGANGNAFPAYEDMTVRRDIAPYATNWESR